MGGMCGGTRVTSDTPISSAWTAYAWPMPPSAIRIPPSAGPATEVTELSAELMVSARVNNLRGTMAGRMAWRAGYSNDDARPVTSTRA